MFRPDPLLTEAQVRDYLGVSRTTLWRLRTREGLPFIKIGSEIRYDSGDLRTWIASSGRKQTQPDVSVDGPRRASESRWKQSLESTAWDFEKEPTNGLTHHLHPYPAKFPPPLPRRLIEILTSPGDTVLDPFCGSGTTLVEARSLGRNSVGIDSNPIAALISTAKTVVLSDAEIHELERLANAVDADAERLAGRLTLLAPFFPDVTPMAPPEIPNRERWFTEQAIQELGLIRARLEEMSAEAARTVARACFSAILVQASNQDSETRYTARSKNADPGDTLRRFVEKVRDAVRMHHAWAAIAPTASVSSLVADARGLHPLEVGTVDAVVTSPPYANAFDYHLYHRHRLFWLGFDPAEVRRAEIGSHLNHQSDGDAVGTYRSDMRESMRAMTACLKSGGPLAFVVGDSVFSGKVINNARVLSEVGREVGLRTVACVDRAIHSNKRSMIHAARRAREEHILLLVKE